MVTRATGEAGLEGVPRLYGKENYLVWRMVLRSYFKMNKSWEIVNGTSHRPNDSLAREEWDHKNDRAMYTILTSIDNDQRTKLLRFEAKRAEEPTAADYWRLLEDENLIFEQEWSGLHSKLRKTRYDGKGDIGKHLAKMQFLVDQLAILGKSVSDDEFFNAIQNSLPQSWKQKKVGQLQAFEATPDELIKYIKLTANEDRDANQRERERNRQSSALAL